MNKFITWLNKIIILLLLLFLDIYKIKSMAKVRKYFRDPDSLELNKFLFTSDSSSSSSAYLKNKNVCSHSSDNLPDNIDHSNRSSSPKPKRSYCIRTRLKVTIVKHWKMLLQFFKHLKIDIYTSISKLMKNQPKPMILTRMPFKPS